MTDVSSALLMEAKSSPALVYMIKHGLPLTRERWMDMNYDNHPPKVWTAEHEAEVPTPFQHVVD